jgi:hypothetical protein
MSEPIQTPAEADQRRGRTGRADGVREERRRRQSDQTSDPTLERFGISPELLDHSQFVYRAAVDKGMRLHNLTVRDDWDFVNIRGETAKGAQAEGVVRYQADLIDGKPVYSYLLRKLKRYADADRREKADRILGRRAGLRRQRLHAGPRPKAARLTHTPKR